MMITRTAVHVILLIITSYVVGTDCFMAKATPFGRLIKRLHDRSSGNSDCGVPVHTPHKRLIGDNVTEATEHSWPWMASLKVNGQHVCGGTIVKEQWILSSRHCASLLDYYGLGTDDLTVALGIHSHSDPLNEEEYKVDKIYLHPDHMHRRKPDKSFDDIMLIKLKKNINMSNNVAKVCLPGEDAVKNTFPPGTDCVVTGWGATTDGEETTDSLHQVKVTINDVNECFRDKHAHTVHRQKLLCTGFSDGSLNICSADTGGPLMCKTGEPERWEQIGIVTRGDDCADPKKLHEYANVQNYKPWIDEKMENHPY